MAQTLLRGNPVQTAGDLPTIGAAAPAFTLKNAKLQTALILSASFGLLRGESARNDGLVDNGLYRQRDRQCYFVTVY